MHAFGLSRLSQPGGMRDMGGRSRRYDYGMDL